jgi:hypothetical protein
MPEPTIGVSMYLGGQVVTEPPPSLDDQLADARIAERRRCALVIQAHRTEIDVGTSYHRLMTWLEEGTDQDPRHDHFAEVDTAAATDIGAEHVFEGDIGEDIAEDTDPDRAAAMQLCSGLVDELVEFIANMRRLSEENERLRGQLATAREHAELKVNRAGDFLRTALGIIEAGEEQYRSPEAPEAPGHRGDG